MANFSDKKTEVEDVSCHFLSRSLSLIKTTRVYFFLFRKNISGTTSTNRSVTLVGSSAALSFRSATVTTSHPVRDSQP